MSQYIGKVGKTVPSFPWVYISLGCGTDQVLSQTKLLRTLGGSIPQPIPLFPLARLAGFFDTEPPPAAIFTSMVHVPAFPLSLIHI